MKAVDWIKQHSKLPTTVKPDAAFDAILDLLLTIPCLRDIYVASDDGILIGHISHHRLSQLLLAEYRPVHTRRQLIERVIAETAKEIMEPHFETAHIDEELDEILHRQLNSGVEEMPVLDDSGLPIGVINLTQILRITRKNHTVITSNNTDPSSS
ncbi:CBS domain-containing protein [Pseudomonadota bacterium]